MKLLIIFATTGGTTQRVVEMAIKKLEIVFDITVKRAEQAKISDMIAFDKIILAVPTYNVGRLCEYYVPFHKNFLKANNEGKSFGIIALGDSKNYDVFCGASKILEDAVLQTNGKISSSIKIDGFDIEKIDNQLNQLFEEILL